MKPALKIFAGHEALAHIRANGLHSSDIDMMLGASGGPKWLSLAAMDRYLLSEWVRGREQPLHVLGTSAGAWRMACYAQNDPLAAHARLQEAYISQQYASAKTHRPRSGDRLPPYSDVILGESGTQEIINNPVVRLSHAGGAVVVWQERDHKVPQTLGLAGAMTANLFEPPAVLCARGLNGWCFIIRSAHRLIITRNLPARHRDLNRR